MKNLILYFAAIALFFNNGTAISQHFIKDQQTHQLIRDNIRALHKDKSSLPDTAFKIDTRLTKVTEIICSDTFRTRHDAIIPGDIRKLLREEQIYDYNVHYISLPVPGLKNSEISRAFEKNNTLNAVLDNPYVKKQGVVVEQTGDQYTIHLLFTEHYVDITDLTLEVSIYPGDTKYEKTYINGISFMNEIFYLYKKTNKKNIVQQDSANHFQIVIQEQLSFPVEFFDASGKKLSVYQPVTY